MLFTFIVAATASQALGLRPAATASSRSVQFATLHDLVAAASTEPSKNLATLHDAADIVNGIMLQSRNATEHLSPADQELLNRVIAMLNDSMYVSMNSSHHRDINDLADAIAAINQCYGDFAARVADGGDLTILHDSAKSYQDALDALQDDVDEKTLANNTAWNNLQTHIALISDAPQCPALPNPRTMPALDVYFENSVYVVWWTAQKAAYEPIRDAYLHADHQLREAFTAYAVGLAVRDVSYCDWKRELEAACEEFSRCYEERKAHYLNVVKPAVEEDMKMRIEAYKAGETIIHNIRFLLAEEPVQAVGAINTEAWQIAFPAVPAKPECDLSALDDPSWVPTPVCTGCDENTNIGHRQDGYRGCQDHSRTGNECQNWITARNNWARIQDGESERFPDKGLGDHNFCRNPDHEPEGIWCWTAATWEYCNPLHSAPPLKQLLNGCTTDGTTLSGWGSPRIESADQRAGEAICCDSAGQATRHVHDGSATFGTTSHEICTTPNGGRLFEGDSPSYTFFEAKALCGRVGLSLCSTQAQLDSTCGTGCWLNTVLIWVE